MGESSHGLSLPRSERLAGGACDAVSGYRSLARRLRAAALSSAASATLAASSAAAFAARSAAASTASAAAACATDAGAATRLSGGA